MNDNRFDTISKMSASRRLSRRQSLAQGGAGFAASALAVGLAGTTNAQEATPITPADETTRGPETLFLQSFQQGSITPKEGTDGMFELTLEHGLGQTIYFSDRPDRVVGATPTPQFLDSLGFPSNNPPNAALVVTSETEDTDIVVMELFNPRYDDTTHTATYDVTPLKEWESTLDVGFTEASADLAELHPTFGAAHLFIDDCAIYEINCQKTGDGGAGGIGHTEFNGMCYSYAAWECLPCTPWIRDEEAALKYWAGICNERFPDLCKGECFVVWIDPSY